MRDVQSVGGIPEKDHGGPSQKTGSLLDVLGSEPADDYTQRD
ncbi:Uncharacterised protein [Mycobacteroides abscessus subsp. massiliense]|nr:Uncharacterised protein [Mycobacteroides abscessus subsp. massiliense]